MSNPQVDVDMVQTLQAKNPMAVAFAKTHKPMSDTDPEGWSPVDAAPTVTHWPRDRSDTGTDVAVIQPVAIQDVRAVEKAQNGRGWNDDGTAYTVDTHATQGVAQPVAVGSLCARTGLSMSLQDAAQSHLLATTAQPVAFGGDVARTLSARHDSSPCVDRGMDVVAASMQVRRLTPVECERLQGFPDDYTNIPWRKATESPDGPRYKALGNSMAVPVMNWIGQRIQKVSEL